MRFSTGLVAVLCVLGTDALAQTVFTEAGGVVVIEAEDFSNNTPHSIDGTNFQWIATNAISGFSGNGYMEATPNVGANQSVTWRDTSPELDYSVNFSQSGTHYVWVRAFAFTNTDDSVHAGLNGITNTAFGISLGDAQTNFWAWTTNRVTGVSNRATISASTGTYTFSLWMREDGMRVDKIILTTNINFQASLGNAFHIPNGIEAGSGNTTMRSPVEAIFSNTAVFLYTGNQFQGSGGNPGNQLQTGSTILYRNATNTTWSSLPMAFWYTGGASGNNKYYSNSIPANLFSAGDTVQYYFKIAYSDHLPTFVGGNNIKYEIEADAQANPFSYTVQGPLIAPSGCYIAYSNVVGSTIYEVRIFQNSGQITLSGPDLAGNPLANTITIEPPSATVNGNNISPGPVFSSAPLSNGLQVVEAFGSTSVVVQITFPNDGVMHYEVADWGAQVVAATAITAPSDPSEHFYGFGEKFNALDQSGNKVHILTRDIAGDKGDNSYKVVPWFISTRGYGFHLDSSAESYFDMRNEFSDRYVINNLFGTLKFNVICGPRLTDVLTRYTGYSGRPALPPKWAFAPWMSSDVWHTGGEVRYAISKYRALGIPGSAFVFDSPWEVGYNDFTWNTAQWGSSGICSNINGGGASNYLGFASVTDMMTFLRTNGFYAICWMTPFVDTSSLNPEGVAGLNTNQSANYAEGAASNYFVLASSGGPPLVVPWWKGSGSPIDFTNPNAARWAQRQLSNLVAQSLSGGFNVIGGFKTDDGETDNGSDTYIPTTAVYSDGRTGIEMRNGFCVEYHKMIWNVLGTNGLLLARSGFSGSQAYSGHWAGDNQPNFGDSNGLPSVVVAGLSSAMSGFSIWASDVGGYQNSSFSSTPDNLFMRWTQFGAFSPLMQMHRQVDTSNLQQFPWGYSADALTNYLFYARLHTALFPYIYSYAVESSTNGLPIMRPLVLMFQTDPNTYGGDYNASHSYLFGNELLVAPAITNTVSIRSVYLPEGNWYDFFTNLRYHGGQTVIWTNTNQSQMPLFVCEGGIIPMISTNVQTLCDASYVSNPAIMTMDDSLQFLVYPTTNSSFTVYDGTTLSCQSNGTVITATLNSNPRPILLRFFAAQPFGVERDGVRLPQRSDSTEFDANDRGWFSDSDGFVNVKFNHMGGVTQIAFGPDSVGDGISDSWRASQFGAPTTTNANSCATCDPDGDGLNNRQEYLAGTIPLDSSNLLKIDSATTSGSNVVINFGSVLGMKYQVEYSADLSSGTWPVLTNGVVGTGGSLPIIDPNGTGLTQRFYRIRLLP